MRDIALLDSAGDTPGNRRARRMDTYRMCQTSVKDNALSDLSLLDKVVEFKMTFWRSNAARYDLCKPGTMRLVPPEDQMQLVRDDYARMRNMLFGNVPTIEEVIASIAALENEINGLA